MKEPSNASAPPTWPVIVALGLVALLIVGMFFIELIITRNVAAQVDQIVQNTQRSIVLLDDLRAKAQNLSEIGITPREKARLSAGIASDARAYDPIANGVGEAEEWRHLQELLAQLVATSVDDQVTRDRLANEVDASVDGLVSINTKESEARAGAVHDAHAGLLHSDELIGGLTLGLVVLVSVVLIRVLARQRQLVLERFKLLDDRTRDLEAFAGRAAHDLRSPMNPIRGYADLLLEAGSPADVAMMARRIRTAVDRMARVVDDMLALSTAGRPVAGASQPEEVALAVIEEMGADLHGVEVTTAFASGAVACSASVLHQMLRNLLGNALKFRARSRGLHVAIEAREAGSLVEIVVEDNGVGMDAETAEHALEPLYRGRMDREVPGHGLGLAIVDRAARSLGGSCELASALDRGTRITVRLPRA
jgi:signal transduction histidine kinase